LTSWKVFYESVWHHPGLAWGGSLFAGLALQRSKHVPTVLSWGLALAILADAWLTSTLAPPLGKAGTAAMDTFFVILGDARFFLLGFLVAGPTGALDLSEPRARLRSPALASVGFAVLAALPIPLLAYAAKTFLPFVPDLRRMFMVYETTFALLAAVIYLRSGPGAAWGKTLGPMRKLALFECAQYTLWVLADLVILLGYDFGYALRLIPNALYYVAFVPFAMAILDAAIQRRRALV
jgi:hypothetical protein